MKVFDNFQDCLAYLTKYAKVDELVEVRERTTQVRPERVYRFKKGEGLIYEKEN